MKKALIIGAAGFVGNYLIDHIQKNHIWSIAVTKLPYEKKCWPEIVSYNLDIMDQTAVRQILEKERPDYIFHLAAQSSVALSWEQPGLTVDINIKGSLNILDAARTLDYQPRILLIGSGEEYGYVHGEGAPLREDTALRPGNIYAATKACQNMLGEIYAQAYRMNIMMVRAFNHIGPNQSARFVVSDFCRQVAEIELGKIEPIIRVGNLGAKRDFSDVRDVVRAYAALMEKGTPGEIYNVGSGRAVEIRNILDLILQHSSVPIKVEIDPAKMRPIDVKVIVPDIQKLTECTGWQPEIPLEKTIEDTLQYWRKTLLNNAMYV